MSAAVRQWNLEPVEIAPKSPVPKDFEISRSIQGRPIGEICDAIGIDQYDSYGKDIAKIKLKPPAVREDSVNRGNYVVVTGVTPTAYGEGKSTTMLGLVQALTAHLKRNSFACMRQPSQGPTFGMKGGAAGGGYSQVWPMDKFNLHLTGDIHAVTVANNLIAAAVDARMFHESTQTDADLFKRLAGDVGFFTNAQKRRLQKLAIDSEKKPSELTLDERRRFARLDIDPDRVTICRVMDTNDRFLRKITIGQSATEKGRTRETKFAISVASELMAILALASDFDDVCRRVERMIVGFSRVSDDNPQPKPVTCDDLCVSGAVCALIKDAVDPTILQTLEGTPVLVHCGPFANIAHGNSSIIADKIALDLVGKDGFVVTEAGFASDVGFEKFMDIKCRQSDLLPDCAVLVTTLRAIKLHGRELLNDKQASDKHAIDNGLINMNAHIKNITRNFNVPVVVAMNKFAGDSPEELSYVRERAIEAGATDCQVSDNWAQGGRGSVELAQSVIQTCDTRRASGEKAKLLYESKGVSIIDKIETITTKVYGAKNVSIPEAIREKIAMLEANGFGDLPICIAKTSQSISHDAKLKGAPTGYTFPILDCDVSAGAGFVYALAENISTMPGLPTRPGFFDIAINPDSGLIDGLF